MPLSLLTKDVVVTKEDRLVEFGLAEPACLLRREEDLNGDVLISPLALPDLAIATFSDAVQKVDLLCDRSLNLNRCNNKSLIA